MPYLFALTRSTAGQRDPDDCYVGSASSRNKESSCIGLNATKLRIVAVLAAPESQNRIKLINIEIVRICSRFRPVRNNLSWVSNHRSTYGTVSKSRFHGAAFVNHTLGYIPVFYLYLMQSFF
jgi:hypothetical protein